MSGQGTGRSDLNQDKDAAALGKGGDVAEKSNSCDDAVVPTEEGKPADESAAHPS